MGKFLVRILITALLIGVTQALLNLNWQDDPITMIFVVMAYSAIVQLVTE